METREEFLARVEAEQIARRRAESTPELVFVCDLVFEALRRTGAEVKHVIPSLLVTNGIEMCFRQPKDKRADWPEYGWRAFGYESTAERVVSLVQSLTQCGPNDIETAIMNARASERAL